MLDFVNLMNINFNNKNNRYYVIFFMVSVFSAIVFLASYKDVQSVFANPPVMKDQMSNMTGTQNKNMMMDPNQMLAVMKQMNKTGMMMAGQQPPMMGPMMGMGQGMAMPCMMMAPMMMGNQTMMGMMPCMMNPGMMMGGQQPPMMGQMMMMDPNQMQTMMKQMNKTGMMMGPMMGATNK